MNSRVPYIIICGILGVLLVLVVGIPSHQSQIVVNMPKDAQPLATLTPSEPPTKVITQERAILWWSVFKAMSDRGYDNAAIRAANEAVDKVYGPLPSKP